jgi:protein-S-isoprenylcysteine O-methyltransferase Ste14
MSSAVPPQPPQIPGQVPFKSAQHEFTDEHNRTFSGLSDAMRSFANLMKILGAVFAVLVVGAVILALMKQTPEKAHVGPWGLVVGLLPFAVLCLAFGFWAGRSAGAFRKIAESKNEDVWNLMKALGSLKNMFALLRFLMLATIVLLIVGAAVVGIGRWLGE